MTNNLTQYSNSKAAGMYQLYLQGKPCKKVYAAVKKGDKYIVLSVPDRKYKYQISGGGVDLGEKPIEALKRELREEINVNVKNVKSLGHYKTIATWTYMDKTFDVDYLVEIFSAEFDSYANNDSFGLEGEFGDGVRIAEVSKQEMLENVAQFVEFGIKLDWK